jgi:hypothetical protein
MSENLNYLFMLVDKYPDDKELGQKIREYLNKQRTQILKP